MSEARVFDKDDTAEIRRRMRRNPLFTAPTEPRPWQDRLMQREVDRLIVIANGAVMSYQPRTTAGEREHEGPSGALLARADRIVERYDTFETHERRLIYIAKVQRLVDSLRLSRISRESGLVRGTAEWREKIAADPHSLRQCARIYDLSKSEVQRIKRGTRVTGARSRQVSLKRSTRMIRGSVPSDSVSTVAP